jgi:hypothetical protein
MVSIYNYIFIYLIIYKLFKLDIIEEMYKNVTTISYLFEEIEKNLKYLFKREDTYSNLLSNIASTVQNLTICKILVIILLTGIQILFLKKLFWNDDNTKTHFNY